MSTFIINNVFHIIMLSLRIKFYYKCPENFLHKSLEFNIISLDFVI